jgi:RsiW-degrading membrane proteinase PrsW (M82 family)
MLLFYLVLAAIFSTLAALCAFIITYGEYLKHYPDRKKPLKMAIRTALAAFLFFMLLSSVIAVIIIVF